LYGETWMKSASMPNLASPSRRNIPVLANQSTVPAGYSENQIRSVNVYLGARSDNPSANGRSKPAYIRNSLQTQVCLRSMAYVNQFK